ncbi:MAG: endonuclease III domain-containing protein, partial [Phycisphaerae bacterium]
ELAHRIRPAGYYNLKARRLKHFVDWLWRCHDGDFDRLEHLPWRQLREALLGINGIGRETADAILLYALDKPSFVVDAYTARVIRRHGLIDDEADYEELKSLFEDHLPDDVALFNEFHALFVAVGKRHCRPRARCEGCPLAGFDHDEALR